MKHIFSATLLLLLFNAAQAQQTFTKADTLRGMLTPPRSCYDVVQYFLSLKVDVSKQTISGYNNISYRVVSDFDSLQIDLFANLIIDSITRGKSKLRYRRVGNAVFVQMDARQTVGEGSAILVRYHGRPLPAKHAPWDGGFVWSKDANGKTWLGTACQGTGASSWWPCKDHQSDEPEYMHMDFTVPSDLVCVSNGQLGGIEKHDDGTTTWTYSVSYPINNYNVTLNLADYAHIKDYYIGINGDSLHLDYYVLKYNEAQAKQHFQQVKTMLGCYERDFGPYPFYRDGYKLIETTYWGMEHQSAIAYGNAFQNTPYGFDYIIIHESAHEWWGNELTAADNADMWLHESFATYAEALYVECQSDYATGLKYMHDIRWQIADKHPIIGPYNVNFVGSDLDNDMYYKGAWMIQSFRSQLNNDTLFFSVLHGVLQKFGYLTTNSNDVLAYIESRVGQQYKPLFDQYLRHASPPTLLMKKRKKKGGTELTLQWQTDVNDFTMNVDVTNKAGEVLTSTPVVSNEARTVLVPNVKPKEISISDARFYFKK